MTTLLYSGYHNFDTEKYPFEVNPFFYYITSCDLPNITLLTQKTKSYVFVDIPDISTYDAEHFKTTLQYCFNATIVDLSTLLKLLETSKLIETLPNIKSHPLWNKLRKYPMDMTTISLKLIKKREVKFIDEISDIKKACKYTSDGIKHIMKNAYPKMSQIELIGLFKQSISKDGIQELSFNPITAHGTYNQYLHYEAKNRPVTKGTMVLLDLGCKYKHYCSDISRCFPISGIFTKKQTKIYNVVLHSLKYALTLMKPGQTWQNITHKVKLKLYEECLQIKLVNKLQNESEKIQVVSYLMPHGLGHHVGLDNHDCGPIDTLQENMVIAVEPGIYFQTGKGETKHINTKEWKNYKSIGGIRIEDTIVITSKGHKNLSKVTKEIDEIETLMK